MSTRRRPAPEHDCRSYSRLDGARDCALIAALAARGYPKSGFVNKLQHTALLSEIVAKSESEHGSSPAPERRVRRHGRGGGGGFAGPGQFLGGMVGGIFERR